MVRAILEGRKTQTRRVVKPQPFTKTLDHSTGYWNTVWELPDGSSYEIDNDAMLDRCPYGVPGDRLWVRETFVIEHSFDDNTPPFSDGRPLKTWDDDEFGSGWQQAHYAATDALPDLSCAHASHEGEPCPHPWKPSIHMPRWASRITLEITGVRVERVQEITPEAAKCEGVEQKDNGNYLNYPLGSSAAGWQCPRNSFHTLWDSINAKRGYGWDKNPWVWVVEFKRVDQ